MTLRRILLVGLLTLAATAQAQIFDNTVSTLYASFSTSFSGPITADSPNHFNSDAPGLASLGAYGWSDSFGFSGAGQVSEGTEFYINLYVYADGFADLIVTGSFGESHFDAGAFEVRLSGAPLALASAGQALSGFTIYGQDASALVADFDPETGFVVFTVDESFDLAENSTYSMYGSFETAAIPEPASVALGLGLGAAFLAIWRRRARAGG